MKLRAWVIAAALGCCIVCAARADNPTTSMPLHLKTEQGSDFFTFFHLAEVGVPTTVGASQAWHSFRPSGPAFHDLVELDVLAAADGTIGAASLGLDRSFIDDPRNGIFARDIVKSFLAWTDRKPSPPLSGLISNLADLSSSGGSVIIMRGPAPPPPPPDATGGYGVYLGHNQHADFADDGMRLAFTNFPGTLPSEGMVQAVAAQDQTKPGWLRIDVRFGNER